MARSLKVEIDGDSTSGRRAIDSLAAEADKAAKDLDKMAAKADAASVKARKLAEAEERAGDKTRQLTERMAALQREIAENGDESGALTRKLERLKIAVSTNAHATDDYRRAASRASAEAREQARAYDKVADNARQAARAVAMLGAASLLPGGGGGRRGGKGSWLRNLLGLGVEGAEGAIKIGGSAVGAVGSALGAVGSAAGPAAGPIKAGIIGGVGVGVGVPAALLGGSAIGGAVGLGIGAAGAGAGLAGAWMGDPQKYGAMWDKAIDGIQRRWMDSSRAFGGELENDLKIVDRTLRDLPVEKVLALSQGFSTPLVEGAGAGITAAADGFADAMEHVQTIADQVGPALGNFGADVGQSLRLMSAGAEDGGAALADLIAGVGYTVKGLGLLVLTFERAYGAAKDFGQGIENNVMGLIGMPATLAIENFGKGLIGIDRSSMAAGKSLGGFDDAASRTTRGLGDVAKAAAEATAATVGYNDALTAARDTAFGMADATFALEQGWIDLKAGLDDGAKTLDRTKQAGLDNALVIEQQIKNAEALRQQMIKTGDGTAASIDAANAKYAENIEIIKQAAYAAHFNKEQVDALVLAISGIPPAASTEIKTPGMFGALVDAARLAATLGNINGTFTAHIRLAGIADAARAVASLAGAHAAGGTMGWSGPKLVGEKGPEIVWGSKGEYVSTAAQTQRLVSRMTGPGGGGSAPTVSLTASAPAGGIDQALLGWFVAGVRSGAIPLRDGNGRPVKVL
jgi:hypothetical protein